MSVRKLVSVSINKELGGKFDISLPGIKIRDITTRGQRQLFISTCLTNDETLVEKYSLDDSFSSLMENFLIPFEKDYFSFSLKQIPTLKNNAKGALPSSPYEHFQKAYIKAICVHYGFEKLFYIWSVSYQLSAYYNFNTDDSDFDEVLGKRLADSCEWSNYGHLEVLGVISPSNGLNPAPNPYSFFSMFYHFAPYQFFIGLAAAIKGDNVDLLRKMLDDLKILDVKKYLVSSISVDERDNGKILIQESRGNNGKFEAHLLDEKNVLRWSLLFKCQYDNSLLGSPLFVKSETMSDFLINLAFGKHISEKVHI